MKILIIIVHIILVAEQHLDDVAIGCIRGFHLVEIGEAAQAAGDVAGRQRVPFKHCHDAYHIEHRGVRSRRLRLDSHQIELLRTQTERIRRERFISPGPGPKFRRYRQPIDIALGDHQKADGVNGS